MRTGRKRASTTASWRSRSRFRSSRSGGASRSRARVRAPPEARRRDRAGPGRCTRTTLGRALPERPRGGTSMALSLARNWWALALRGAAAIVFGIIALFWPPAAVAALVAVFGAYALVDGILNLVAAVRAGRSGQRWGALVFEGIVSVLVGILTLFFPPLFGAIAIAIWIGAYSVVFGALLVGLALRLRSWASRQQQPQIPAGP